MAIGLLLTSLLGAGQALLLVFVVGEGEATDAFLAAYSVYTPIALLGASMRRSLVPLLGVLDSDTDVRRRAAELISRVTVLALVVTGLVALCAPLLAEVLVRGLSEEARRTTLLTLLVLAPTAFLHIYAGAMGAVLNAVRRYPVSIAFYVLAGAFALAASAGLLQVVGVVGSGLGLLAGALVLASAHTGYFRGLGINARLRRPWLLGREQANLAFFLIAGVSLGASQQLNLAVALSAVSGEVGSITVYAYAYFIVGLMLNLSSTPLSLVALPDLVEALASTGRAAIEERFLAIVPYVFLVLAPMLAAFTAFAEPLLQVVFGPALSYSSIAAMFDLALVLEVMVLPTSLFVLGGSLLLALRQWSKALTVAAVSTAFHATAMYAVAPFGALAVAWAHAGASAVAAVLLLAAVFGRRTFAVVASTIRRSAPAFALAAIFPLARLGLGGDPSPGLIVAALFICSTVYVALALWLWPSVGGGLRRMLQRAPAASG